MVGRSLCDWGGSFVSELGLSGYDGYMHARYYSPNLGRFLSVDPVGGKVGSSQSWNRYSYVTNNPLVFVDPDWWQRAETDPGQRLEADPPRSVSV